MENSRYCRIFMRLQSNPNPHVTSQCPWVSSSDIQAELIRNYELFKQSNPDSRRIFRNPSDRNRASQTPRMTNVHTDILSKSTPAMRTNYSKNRKGRRTPINAPPVFPPTQLPIVQKQSFKFSTNHQLLREKEQGIRAPRNALPANPRNNYQLSKSSSYFPPNRLQTRAPNRHRLPSHKQ